MELFAVRNDDARLPARVSRLLSPDEASDTDEYTESSVAGSSVALSDELSRADTFDAVFYSDAAGMESVDAQLRDMQEKWSILAPGRQASLDEELLGVISPALDAVVLPESETWGREPERQDPDSPPEVDTSILSDERQTSFDDVLTQVLDEALDVDDLALRPAESVQPATTTPEKIVPTPESSPADRLDTPEQDPYWRETLLMEEAIAAARKGKEAGEDAKAKQKATPPGPKAMKRMKQREDTFAKPMRLDLDPEATSDDALASALGAGPTLATGPAEIQSIDAPEAQAPSGAVTVTFADAGSLGLNLTTTEGRTTVLAVKSDTQAAQHPQLRPGLAITSVDGVDVSSSDHLAVTQTIVDHPQRPLTMTFADPSIPESAPAMAQLSLDPSDPTEKALDDSEEDQAEATPATIRAQRAAELHFNSHEYTAAIRCLEEALAAAPEDDLELTEQIRFVRERQAGEAERYCQTADDLTLERQYDDARAVYEQALGIHPEHAAARHGLARVEALLNLPVTPSAEGEDGRKRKSLFGGRRTGSSPTLSPLQHTPGGPGQDSEGAAELEPFSLSESAIKRAPDDISVALDGDPQTEDEQVKTQEELEGLLTEFTAQSRNEHIQSLRSRLSPGTEAATASTEARRQLEADLLAAQYLSEKLAKEVRIADVCSHLSFVTEMPHVQVGGPEEGLREDEVTPWSESDLDEGIPPEPETRAAMDALDRSQFKLKRWEKAKELTTKELT